jgi:hypothetical protein
MHVPRRGTDRDDSEIGAVHPIAAGSAILDAHVMPSAAALAIPHFDVQPVSRGHKLAISCVSASATTCRGFMRR